MKRNIARQVGRNCPLSDSMGKFIGTSLNMHKLPQIATLTQSVNISYDGVDLPVPCTLSMVDGVNYNQRVTFNKKRTVGIINASWTATNAALASPTRGPQGGSLFVRTKRIVPSWSLQTTAANAKELRMATSKFSFHIPRGGGCQTGIVGRVMSNQAAVNSSKLVVVLAVA